MFSSTACAYASGLAKAIKAGGSARLRLLSAPLRQLHAHFHTGCLLLASQLVVITSALALMHAIYTRASTRKPRSNTYWVWFAHAREHRKPRGRDTNMAGQRMLDCFLHTSPSTSPSTSAMTTTTDAPQNGGSDDGSNSASYEDRTRDGDILSNDESSLDEEPAWKRLRKSSVSHQRKTGMRQHGRRSFGGYRKCEEVAVKWE